MSRKIAVVAIEHPHLEGLFLHGLRNDDGTWCIPGGHFDSGENKLDAAARELFEETGLTADLDFVSDNQTLDWKGKPLHIFLFIGKNPSGDLTASNDPDAEFKQFKYLDPASKSHKFRTPPEKNILLAYLHDSKLTKSMFEQDDLFKVEDEPRIVGEVHENGNVATKHHKNKNLLIWEHGPEKAQYFEDLVNNHKADFLKSVPEANRGALENVINKVSSDPARHYVPTKNDQGQHSMRMRHLGAMVIGHKAASFMPHPDGSVTVSVNRHGSDPHVTSWHVNHKGIASEISNQHAYKHPEASQTFTSSLNRNRFGRDSRPFPQSAQNDSNKPKVIDAAADKLGKNEVQHDRSRTNGHSGSDGQTVRATDQGRSGTGSREVDQVERLSSSGLLSKSYVLVPLPERSNIKLPTSFDGLGTSVRAVSFFKNEQTLPAIIIENPNDLNAILTAAVKHEADCVIMSSGNKSEILYTKGNNSGKMRIGLESNIQKSEPVFGMKVDSLYVDFGNEERLYLVSSPFAFPKS